MSDGSYSGQQLTDEAEFAQEVAKYYKEFLNRASVHQITCYAYVFDARNGVQKPISGFGMTNKSLASMRGYIRFDYTKEGKIDYIMALSTTEEEMDTFLSKVSKAYAEGKSRYITAIRYYNIHTGEFIKGWQADDIPTVR